MHKLGLLTPTSSVPGISESGGPLVDFLGVEEAWLPVCVEWEWGTTAPWTDFLLKALLLVSHPAPVSCGP